MNKVQQACCPREVKKRQAIDFKKQRVHRMSSQPFRRKSKAVGRGLQSVCYLRWVFRGPSVRRRHGAETERK